MILSKLELAVAVLCGASGAIFASAMGGGIFWYVVAMVCASVIGGIWLMGKDRLKEYKKKSASCGGEK